MPTPSRAWAALCAAVLFTSTVFGAPAVPPAPTPTAVAAADQPFDLPATDDGQPGLGPIRREPWFREVWLTHRRQWARDTPKDQGALVFLGDSITQGWGDVSSFFPGLKIANRGISGDTTRGILIRLQPDVLAVHPAGVVLLIGTNDIQLGVAPADIAANLKQIITALRQHDPKMPVVLCAVFPTTPTNGRPTDKIRKLNELYEAAVADEPQVTMLDTWHLFADEHGEARSFEMPDQLHPNVIGYARWAKALRPVLETVGLAPAWPDDFVPEPGFTSLFNGRDLTGWEYEGGPAFTHLAATPDGRYVVRNGRLVVTITKKGHDYKKLWTTLRYPKDFVLKLEFRASPDADSGVFVRDTQLQCRDYLIAGPYAILARYRPLDWNELVVTVHGNLAHATCNGEVIEDAMPIGAAGPIGLESDHGQMEYRRIRIMASR